jgi:hypothetical protein
LPGLLKPWTERVIKFENFIEVIIQIAIFWVVTQYETLKTEAIYSSKTSTSAYKTIWHHSPGDLNFDTNNLQGPSLKIYLHLRPSAGNKTLLIILKCRIKEKNMKSCYPT